MQSILSKSQEMLGKGYAVLCGAILVARTSYQRQMDTGFFPHLGDLMVPLVLALPFPPALPVLTAPPLGELGKEATEERLSSSLDSERCVERERAEPELKDPVPARE